MRRSRAGLHRAGLLLALLFAAGIPASSCGSSNAPTVELQRKLDSPAVYRTSTTAESRFSGPVSELRGATEVTAAFEAFPVSDSAIEVEVLYLAASVRNTSGDFVALELGDLSGKKARVEFDPPGLVSGVTGDEALLDAGIPLIPVEDLIASLFPPLPQESTRIEDTWTGNTPVPFSNLQNGPDVRMRYLLSGVDSGGDASATVEGYELSTGPRSFAEKLASGEVNGRGELDVTFDGEYDTQIGYTTTESAAEFDSNYIRLPGGSRYANGNLHLERVTTVESLNPAEQFGLDPDGGLSE